MKMNKKYSYQIEFVNESVSPTGKRFYGATSESGQKEIKESFKELVRKHHLMLDGGATKGKLRKVDGSLIGRYEFYSISF